jgi:hypothetical protein
MQSHQEPEKKLLLAGVGEYSISADSITTNENTCDVYRALDTKNNVWYFKEPKIENIYTRDGQNDNMVIREVVAGEIARYFIPSSFPER